MKGSSIDGCQDKNYASDRWKDGCLACMYYKNRNASSGNGTQSDYYDNYFQENVENQFSVNNQSNRKYNAFFF